MGAIDTLTPDQQLEAIYVGYFDRAADPGGFAFWEGQYAAATAAGQSSDQALNNIANAFAPQSETLALYSFLGSGATIVGTTSPIILGDLTSLIDSIYNNLFDRTPAAGDAGVAYWVGQLTSGAVQLGQLVLDIANGAQGVDATTLLNKITSADFFTTTEGAAGLGFTTPVSGSFHNAAVDAVSTVTSSAASVTAAEAAATAYAAGGGTGSTFTLTTGIDAPGTGAFATQSILGNNNLIIGTFNGTGATYTAGDMVIGAAGSIGNTLELADLGTGHTATVTNVVGTVSNISTLIVDSGEGVTANTVTAQEGFTGLTQLTVNSATGGGAHDSLTVAATTNVTVNDAETAGGGGVTVDGGNNVTITENSSHSGSITVGGSATTDPAGAVSIALTGTGSNTVSVDGGTTVTVVDSETGAITIGSNVAPSGAVIVTDTGGTVGGAITIDGGATALVTETAATSGSIAVSGVLGETMITETSVLESGVIIVAGGTGATVSTTGWNSTIGVGATLAAVTPVAGDATIVDTFAGLASGDYANADAMTVYATGTVNITTTADAAGIAVGNTTAADDATGAVSIVNETVGDSATYYGTGATIVDVNGAPSVSVTGGGAVTIADEATTNALASVSLTGISGAATIASNALTTLNLTSEAQGVTVTAAAGARALSVTLDGVTGGTITDATATTLNITNTGVASSGVTFDDAAATSVSITANAALSITDLNIGDATTLAISGSALTTLGGGTFTDLTSITITGTGGFTDSSAIPTTVTSIDATGSSGPITVTLDPTTGDTSFAGGSGVNIVTIEAAVEGGPAPTVSGGGNALSELNIGYDPGNGYDPSLVSHISGFHVLGAGFAGIAAGETWDASGFSGLVVDADLGNALTFGNVAAGTSLTFTSSAAAVTYDLATATTSGVLALNLNGDLLTDTVNTESGASGSIGTVNITNTSDGSNTLTLHDSGTAGGTTAITIAGSGTVALTDGDGTVTSIAISGNVDVDLATFRGVSTILFNAIGTSIVDTGTGELTAAFGGSTTANDTITVGGSGGQILLGVEGAVTYSTPGVAGGSLVFATGAQTLNLANETHASSVANSDGGTSGDYAVINGWHVTDSVATSDQLGLGLNGTTLHDAAAGSASGMAGLTYSATNGVVTFTGAATVAQEANAVAAMETAQGAVPLADQNVVAAFQYTSGGVTTTYVEQANSGNDGSVNIEALVGVSGVTGFADSDATTFATGGDSIYANVAGTTEVGVATDATTTMTNEAGDAVIAVSGGGTGGLQTLTNVANSAVINDASTGTLGSIALTQLGTGADLVWDTTSTVDHSLASLTLTNTTDFVIDNVQPGTTFTLTSLVDGGTSPTLDHIMITDAGNVTLTAITDTALTTIDASTSTGTVTITADNMASQDFSLSSTGTTVITAANGAGDYFGQGGAGTVTITSANGAGDTFDLAGGAGTTSVTASGAGDHIYLGTGVNTIVATGAGDVISLVSGNSAANQITVGANAQVTVGTADTSNIVVAGDVAGATSSGAFNFVTVNNAHDGNTLQFFSSGTEGGTQFVNAASATSLANAIDLAASHMSGVTATDHYYAAFAYSGNTYVLEHTGTGVAATAMGASDILVEVTGLSHITSVTASGHGVLL